MGDVDLRAAALLLTLSALFGWWNLRFIHLPHSVGLLTVDFIARLTMGDSQPKPQGVVERRSARRSAARGQASAAVQPGDDADRKPSPTAMAASVRDHGMLPLKGDST